MGEKEGWGETQVSGPRPGRQAASPRAPRISALRPALGAGQRRRPFPLLAEVSTSLLLADLPTTRACRPQQAQRPMSARRGGSELTGQAGPRRREACGARGGAANLACPPGPRARTRSQSRTRFFAAMGAGVWGATCEAQASGTETRGWGLVSTVVQQTWSGRCCPSLQPRGCVPGRAARSRPCALTSPSPARAPLETSGPGDPIYLANVEFFWGHRGHPLVNTLSPRASEE